LKLSDLLKENSIIEVKATDRDSVLKYFVKCIAEQNAGINKDELFQKLLEREKMESTAIENNVAIPHCKIDKLKEAIVMIGISKDGVKFSNNDDNLTKVFFLVVSPSDSPALHLKILASVAKIAKSKELLKKIINFENLKDIKALIKEEENKL